MSAPYELAYLTWCKTFEGNVPFMYCDTDGNVTCGVGFELPTALMACGFPWCLPGPAGVAATAQEVAGEWNRVKAMEKGHSPAYYAIPSALQLKQADIDAHLLTLLDQTDANLQRDYPGFEGFPDAVKMALCDLDYNLGDVKLRNTYPHFDAAVDRQDWATAALQCHRNGVSTARNAWCAAQFSGQTQET